jgi:transcriptional regulator with XRE-family HTH domain
MERGKLKKARDRLREARYRAGLSQSALAERIGVRRETISDWERGLKRPYAFYVKRLCEALGAPGPEALDLEYLQHKSTTNGSAEPQDSQTISPIPDSTQEKSDNALPEQGNKITPDRTPTAIVHENENRILEKTNALDLALYADHHSLPDTQSLERYSALIDPLSDDGEMLDLIEQLEAICWSLSKGNELAIAERVLWSYLQKIAARALLPSPHQRRLASLASRGYLLASALAGHRDDLQARQSFSEEALVYSGIAQDRNLQVAALRQLAATFDYLDQPHNVLQTYQRTLLYTDEITPLLRSRIYAGISGTYALLQQRQEAERFLSLAYESFPDKPECDPCYHFADCGYFTLVLWDGLNHLELHQPEQAKKTFEQVDGLHSIIQIPQRVRAEILIYQAATFTALKSLDQACDYLEAAVKLALKLGSKRRLSEALAVFTQARDMWSSEKRVKNLEDLFRS